MDNLNKFYTTGEFAKMAGVTIRTIRFYDKKGLLTPTKYSPAGYRLYSKNEFLKLQKILTLKFLGFSLDEINNEIKDSSDEKNFLQSLNMQKEIIQNKIEHMKLVLTAINEAENIYNFSDVLDWNKVINLIKVINLENSILDQYKNSTNLKTRIDLHDKFSINKYGWHRWVFDKIDFFPGVKILELGCGNCDLWKKNINRIPDSCEITATDISNGMIKDAKHNLSSIKNKFYFKTIDSQNISFKDESFDIVIANHVLFYVKDIEKSLKEIRRVLKPGGFLYASTTGQNHMKELDTITKRFDNRMTFSPVDLTKQFGLENGKEKLKNLFSDIHEYIYEDALIVDESEPIMNYIKSTHGNANEILKDREEELRILLDKRIDEEKKIYITKKSGLFIAKKP